MIPAVRFIETFCTTTEGAPLVLLPHQRAILEHCLTPDAQGRLPYATVVYSCPKKSGKTAINAAITLWAAYQLPAPNELLIVANDLEQAQGRVFKELVRMIAASPPLAAKVTRQTRGEVELVSGTTIKTLAADYAGAAGSNHGLVSFDELWAYTSEGARRLWDELTPVPTRRISLRLVTTYAGFMGESVLLEELYKAGQGGHPVLPDLPAHAAGQLFMYWDHAPRMPWQTKEYYESQRASLRSSAYLRLHENRWVTGAEGFLTAAQVDAITDPAHRPPLPQAATLYVGLDASVKRDSTALVAVHWQDEELLLGPVKVWTPRAGEPVDFAAVEDELLLWQEQFPIAAVSFDPYQLAALAQRLVAAGVPMVELPQTLPNLTEAATTLLDAIQHKRLRLWECATLRGALLNAVLIEGPRGLRIAKEKTSKKIDAAAALSFAVLAATRQGAPGPFVAEVLGQLQSADPHAYLRDPADRLGPWGLR